MNEERGGTSKGENEGKGGEGDGQLKSANGFRKYWKFLIEM